MKTIALIFGLIACIPVAAQDVISLAGTWTVKLDENKTGETQQWYKQSFEQKLRLPGTLDDAGMGQPPTLTADSLTRAVLLHLTRKHSFIGYAWYAKEINIPAQWQGRQIELLLERVIWNTKVWIDGREAGTKESLSAPQRWDLSALLQPGKHLLVLRIDNSKQYDMSTRDMAHSYTNETQIMWNGVIGQLQLTARNPQHIQLVQAYPSLNDRSVSATIELQNNESKTVAATLELQVLDKRKKVVARKRESVQLPTGEKKYSTTIALPSVQQWDEFNPALYTLKTELLVKGRQQDSKTETFGMREITAKDGLLYVNGRRLFLRGTLECNIFPLTGYPPMEKKGWLKVFGTAKAYGLNHIRFHSWCPPEAAFEIADSLGIYLQIELPFWNSNAGKDTALNRFLEAEAVRISEEYGNHPSLCFWSMGNELQGDFNWLSAMVNRWKQEDPRHLYTTTTFTFQRDHGRWPEPADQFFITQYTKKGWVRGQGIFNTYSPDFKTDYTKAVDDIPAPVITHEIGQYSVYPNMNEIRKYTGVLEPLNFKAIRQDLQRKDMLSLSPAFTAASGKFSARLYKEEIERALKTKGVSGFQLLDLHDFPGQGTALVGMLDAFWDSKGLVSADEHRRYCAPVVPLIRFEKPSYTNDELFTAEAEVANFSNAVLKNITPVWTIKDPAGKTIAQGRLPAQTIAIGNGWKLGTISFKTDQIQKATALTLELAFAGTSYKNSWDIWVYPKSITGYKPDVLFTADLNEALNALQQGKKVLLNPDTAALKGVEGRFAPVFWSPVHFPNQPGTMGLLCNPEHAALKHFPTELHSNWQWWDLVTSSKTMILDSLPAQEPVVRVIDNFFKNRKMAMVIEVTVGKGKLILVSANIRDALDKRPAARQLRYSLEQYMSSDQFKPAVAFTEEQLRSLFAAQSTTSLIDKAIQKARDNYAYLMKQLPPDRFPVTYDANTSTLKTSGPEPWVGGFYPGALLYLYETTKDTALYQEALRKMRVLEKEQHNKTTHDLGFMMYCSFGNAYRLHPDPAWRDIIITSARSLASRFNEKTGCIRSWDSDAARFMVIIDNMMNLELLFAATKFTGDSSFYHIAVTHANTTMQNHFRPDYSSHHLVIYDPNTGGVQKKQTVQGAADSSAWARGQAWGLYGYTMTYRETKDKKYLEQANRIAAFMLQHLPADPVFFWDFDAPGIPNTARDVSATAITCSALLELSGYVKGETRKKYRTAATAMLKTLASKEYFADAKECSGFLLKHGVGNYPRNADIDVPLIYADYYFVEAMMRYRDLNKRG